MAMEGNPVTWSIGTWMLGLGMAAAGGVVSFLGRVKRGHARLYNFIELAGEIFIAGFVGLGSYMFILALDQPVGLAAVAAGIGGHMGTRLLYLAEEYFVKKHLPKSKPSDKEHKDVGVQAEDR